MVTQKIYIKLGKVNKSKYKVSASLKPTYNTPMWNNPFPSKRVAIPSIDFAVEVTIPDEKFEMGKVAVAKINFELAQERLIVKTVEAL